MTTLPSTDDLPLREWLGEPLWQRLAGRGCWGGR